MRYDNMAATPSVPEMVFGSSNSDPLENDIMASITTCVSKTLYVDANITCISRGVLGKALCGVGALRQTPFPPGSDTGFMDPYNASAGYNSNRVSFASFAALTDLFDERPPYATDSDYACSATEQYILDPLAGLVETGYADLGSLNITLFERRFSLLWNTLWTIQWTGESATGGSMLEDLPYYTGTGEEKFLHVVTNTTSNVTFPTPATYDIDKPWLVMYFISVGVMFLAAVFALVLRSRCRAPAILGYVSTLVRDSTYFDDCGIDGKSIEGGAETSKRLGKLRVMVADVGGEADGPGKIAFAPVGIGKRVVKEGVYL
jgi:hypothetical protein